MLLVLLHFSPLTGYAEAQAEPFFIKIGHADAKLSGFVQGLFRHYQLDSANDTFSVPRAHLKLGGHVVTNWAYQVQIDVASSPNILRDATIQYEKYPWAKIAGGSPLRIFGTRQEFSAG